MIFSLSGDHVGPAVRSCDRKPKDKGPLPCNLAVISRDFFLQKRTGGPGGRQEAYETVYRDRLGILGAIDLTLTEAGPRMDTDSLQVVPHKVRAETAIHPMFSAISVTVSEQLADT